MCYRLQTLSKKITSGSLSFPFLITIFIFVKSKGCLFGMLWLSNSWTASFYVVDTFYSWERSRSHLSNDLSRFFRGESWGLSIIGKFSVGYGLLSCDFILDWVFTSYSFWGCLFVAASESIEVLEGRGEASPPWPIWEIWGSWDCLPLGLIGESESFNFFLTGDSPMDWISS